MSVMNDRTNLAVNQNVHRPDLSVSNSRDTRDSFRCSELTLPTFEDSAGENAIQYSQSLDQYIIFKGVPTHLRLSVALKYLKGANIWLWASELADDIKTYEQFKY
jgi:hypothetical protein